MQLYIVVYHIVTVVRSSFFTVFRHFCHSPLSRLYETFKCLVIIERNFAEARCREMAPRQPSLRRADSPSRDSQHSKKSTVLAVPAFVVPDDDDDAPKAQYTPSIWEKALNIILCRYSSSLALYSTIFQR